MLLISARCLVMFYISAKFHEIILNGIKVIGRTRFLYEKLQRGIIPQKCRWSDGFYLCTSSGHALYFYQVLWNYLKRYQSYRADTIFILKITKGNTCNSAKNVGGVTVLISARRLVMLYISTKYCEISSNSIKVIERTRFLYWKFQRGIIPQKCRWSDGF